MTGCISTEPHQMDTTQSTDLTLKVILIKKEKKKNI